MSNKFVKSILQMWLIIEKNFSQLTRMTRDLLIVLTIEINCERVFSIASVFYDHRRSYSSTIFNVIMIIRCHNQKKNEMNEKLTTAKNLIMKQLQKEMKTRVKKLQAASKLKYINDIDRKQSDVVSSSASTLLKLFLVSSEFSTIKKNDFIHLRCSRNRSQWQRKHWFVENNVAYLHDCWRDDEIMSTVNWENNLFHN